jgi:microcystin synthetase protein McyJ
MEDSVFTNFVQAVKKTLFTPKVMLKGKAATYYEYLGDDVVEGQHERFADTKKPLWLNLGYWKTARTYPEAAQALAAKLAEAADLRASDALLDAGFGFGEQDLFWVQKYGVASIKGINITPSQVQRARARVKELGLEERIDLRLGSATELPFEAESFDKITALESAHHFDTREDFFQEAYRVLRAGGRLATADGVSSAGDNGLSLIRRMALRRWCVPTANMYDRQEYCRRLEDIGFVNVRGESIRNYVFPGCLKYQSLRNNGVSIYDAVVELTQEEIDQCLGIDLWKVTGISDYVIFSADKP